MNLRLLEGLHCHKTAHKRRELHQLGSRREAPIACTLGSGDYRERLAWIAELARDGLLSVRREDLEIALRYAPRVSDRIREMVSMEQACCAFLNFAISETSEDVCLTITAPERTQDVANALGEQFVPPAVRRAHALATNRASCHWRGDATVIAPSRGMELRPP